MLAMSDTPIEPFLTYFANEGIPVAFLVPTPTGYGKSIMDATASIRQLLLDAHVHDYELQAQGPSNKVNIPAYFVNSNTVTETSASLYRPVTKKGDPRIWFYNLRQYCCPCNLLAIIVIEQKLFVFNLSKPEIANSLKYHDFAFSLLQKASHHDRTIAKELLDKLSIIHNQGFLRSITSGDPGVGDTLEHALGISRNNSKSPDYKGIELKTTRISRNGFARPTTRVTLFTRVPDVGLKYKEIVERYGKWQIPRDEEISRLQIYDTLRCSKANSYNLILNVDDERLNLLHQEAILKKYISAWYLSNLQKALLTKHHETFWIQAVSENHNGIEYFRYDKVLHTNNPNSSLLAPLLESDKITVDLAGYFKQNGKFRDHGVLFKMWPSDLHLLFGKPEEYIL